MTAPGDSHFTYHNPFSNSIIPLQSPISDTMSFDRDNAVANDPALQRFTATGRPIPHPADSRQGRGLSAYGAAETWGAGPPNLLPVRFTDESVISIPVLPPNESSEGVKTVDEGSDSDTNPVKVEPKRKRGFFRRVSSSASKKKDQAFVMKQVTRADYLKYYAKDEQGNYTGTMDPAPDCILNNEKDRKKYTKAFAYRDAKTAGLTNSMAFM